MRAEEDLTPSIPGCRHDEKGNEIGNMRDRIEARTLFVPPPVVTSGCCKEENIVTSEIGCCKF
jgi:hypothetical protein